MAFSESDVRHMRLALRLAARAEGRTAPNPMVGGVVLDQAGNLVGTGWHRCAGTAHGEAAALADAGARAGDGTLYVNLEPCCHFGRTPPCTDAILAAGVARVVAAHRDPFPRVDGGGFARLRSAGVAVETGLLEQEARRLNRAYLKATQLGLPWVTLKMAMTLDGRIATPTGDSRWVTGEPARRYVHRLRDRNDAVVIGAGTALADDPLLTARIPRSRNPMRVVVDTHLRMGDSSRLAQSTADAPLLVATTVPTGGEALQARGVRVERFRNRDGRVDLEELLRRLTTLGVHSVLCEGGPTLAGTLLDLRLVDEVVWFVAPRLLGSGKAALEAGARERMSEAWELHGLRVRRFGEDVALFGYLHQPWLP